MKPAQLRAAHAVIQALREEARNDGQRSDAQCYADAQYLIERKLELLKLQKKGKA